MAALTELGRKAWERLAKQYSSRTRARLVEDFAIACSDGTTTVPTGTEVAFFCNMGVKKKLSDDSAWPRSSRKILGTFFLSDQQINIYSDGTVIAKHPPCSPKSIRLRSEQPGE